MVVTFCNGSINGIGQSTNHSIHCLKIESVFYGTMFGIQWNTHISSSVATAVGRLVASRQITKKLSTRLDMSGKNAR